MRINPDHPHCDSCAMPNSSQQVAVAKITELEAVNLAATVDPYTQEVMRVCYDCALGYLDWGLFAPLQHDFQDFVAPIDRNVLKVWLLADQARVEALYS